MSTCDFQSSGDIEQYFYGELSGTSRRRVEEHLAVCAACRELLEEMDVIQSALSAVPDVSAPPGGDWSHFMARLESAVRRPPMEKVTDIGSRNASVARTTARPVYVGYVALAAMLALITLGVVTAMRDRDRAESLRTDRAIASNTLPSVTGASTPAAAQADRTQSPAALAALTEQHFERSKLVVLGLAAKDPARATPSDWIYERQLASNLLDDTRLYRMAAEERGMEAVARVMRDLELVLLQTSLGESSDPETLAQIQRLIRKRDLVTKMNVLTTGL